MTERLRVALLFGGRSAEHDVSVLSAGNVFRALDPARYAVEAVAIGRDGIWRRCALGEGDPFPSAAPADGPRVAFLPGDGGRLTVLDGPGGARPIDVVVPVLHGPNGEDGTVQGLLELAGVPYVGSGVMGSAAAMDKDVAKRLLRDAGLPIVPFLALTARRRVSFEAAAAALGSRDLFVKPANMGSSVGVSRARSAAEFDAAVALALRYDGKLLVERAVPDAREVECSVLETADGEIRVSVAGEIAPAPAHGFYSYDAKYVDAAGARLVIPAELPPALSERIRDLARVTFETLCCGGLARVDFFVAPGEGGEVFVNEANTLPGFTAISMYPKLWEADGLPGPALMDALIGHALARHRAREAG
ncbi:MAG TPA: D-alanine--D-alanine ligase family protein [Salinarimonas sp.]|jgi:D-alanine-D-alanine ligase|nr:D-alanine--D-alanine ligase family protein [Salinarimonas sp.]